MKGSGVPFASFSSAGKTFASRMRHDRIIRPRGSLAQWLERRSHKPLVAGSNPAGSTIFYALIIKCLSLISLHCFVSVFLFRFSLFLDSSQGDFVKTL